MGVIWWIFALSLSALIHKKGVKVVEGKIVIFIVNRSYCKASNELKLWDLTCY